jgi:hypothetical protein
MSAKQACSHWPDPFQQRLYSTTRRTQGSDRQQRHPAPNAVPAVPGHQARAADGQTGRRTRRRSSGNRVQIALQTRRVRGLGSRERPLLRSVTACRAPEGGVALVRAAPAALPTWRKRRHLTHSGRQMSTSAGSCPPREPPADELHQLHELSASARGCSTPGPSGQCHSDLRPRQAPRRLRAPRSAPRVSRSPAITTLYENAAACSALSPS